MKGLLQTAPWPDVLSSQLCPLERDTKAIFISDDLFSKLLFVECLPSAAAWEGPAGWSPGMTAQLAIVFLPGKVVT